MTTVFTFRIDGKDVAGSEGQTVMEVAEENGIDIPGLCHLEGIHDRGACRLCMVEIAGSPKLAAACMTKIAEGMDVTAHSDVLLEYRRTVTEMMFVERNHVCAVCVANNHCELQDMAEGLGVTHFDLPRISPKVDIDASHRLFAIDHNRCILCLRCVRVCDEIEGAHTCIAASRPGSRLTWGSRGASPPPARAAGSASRSARPARSSRRAGRLPAAARPSGRSCPG